jgi:hypothetical protein
LGGSADLAAVDQADAAGTLASSGAPAVPSGMIAAVLFVLTAFGVVVRVRRPIGR